MHGGMSDDGTRANDATYPPPALTGRRALH